MSVSSRSRRPWRSASAERRRRTIFQTSSRTASASPAQKSQRTYTIAKPHYFKSFLRNRSSPAAVLAAMTPKLSRGIRHR